MLPSGDKICKAVVLLTAATACSVVYITAPDTYAADGRAGVALLILIAVSIVAMVAFLGFLTLEVQSELEEEKKRRAENASEAGSTVESKKHS